jgi:ADP-ribosylglycohydrolase
MTHSDPKAEYGAFAVALAASLAASRTDISPVDFHEKLLRELPDADAEFTALTRRACEAAGEKAEASNLINELRLQKGITGYTYHTVPLVLYYWLRYQTNFEKAITGIISHGGDTDTTAAILGGIIGARVGVDGIPSSWQKGIIEWPRSLGWLQKVAQRLESVRLSGQPERPVSLFIPGVIVRNLLFIVIVLLHGFRRLLPA